VFNDRNNEPYHLHVDPVIRLHGIPQDCYIAAMPEKTIYEPYVDAWIRQGLIAEDGTVMPWPYWRQAKTPGPQNRILSGQCYAPGTAEGLCERLATKTRAKRAVTLNKAKDEDPRWSKRVADKMEETLDEILVIAEGGHRGPYLPGETYYMAM